MDSLFGIGLPEFVVIMLIAGIVMGPERIGQAARWLGKITAKLQGISRTFFSQLNAELDSVDSGGDIRAMVEEVKDLRREFNTLRADFVSASDDQQTRTTAMPTTAMPTTAMPSVDGDVARTIAPPGLTRLTTGAQSADTTYRIPSLAQPQQGPAAAKSAPATSLPRLSTPLPGRVHVSDDPDE